MITPEQHEQIQVWLDAAGSGAYGAVDGVYGAAHLIKALFAEVQALEARLADRTAWSDTPSEHLRTLQADQYLDGTQEHHRIHRTADPA